MNKAVDWRVTNSTRPPKFKFSWRVPIYLVLQPTPSILSVSGPIGKKEGLEAYRKTYVITLPTPVRAVRLVAIQPVLTDTRLLLAYASTLVRSKLISHGNKLNTNEMSFEQGLHVYSNTSRLYTQK